jgi:hypothetical protein
MRTLIKHAVTSLLSRVKSYLCSLRRVAYVWLIHPSVLAVPHWAAKCGTLFRREFASAPVGQPPAVRGEDAENHISCVHTVWSSANSHDIFMLKSTLLRCCSARMAHLSLYTPTYHMQDVFCLAVYPSRAFVYSNKFDVY